VTSVETANLLKPHNCQNCIYAVNVAGHGRSVLICTNRQGSNGRLTLAERAGSCRNFQEKAGVRNSHVSQPQDKSIRFIPLTKGMVATVDAHDYPRISRHKWYACKRGEKYYARRQQKRRYIYMHREVCRAPPGLVVDHIDGNALNNRNSNLRLCTARQNMWNRRPSGGRSLYKGVCWRVAKKKWAAQINRRGRRYHLGYFDSEIEAAKAYDKKAAQLFGHFAWLNFDAPTAKAEPSRKT
jgi:hypothetical protein